MNETGRRVIGRLSEAVPTVVHAETLEDALVALASALQDEYGLWRASVFAFSDEDHVRILAVWSAGETVLGSGSEIAVDLRPAVRKYVELMRLGKPVTFNATDVDLGIINDLMRAESIASWVGIPLRENGRVIAALSLGSSSPNAFHEYDILLLSGLGLGLEPRLIELIHRHEAQTLRDPR